MKRAICIAATIALTACAGPQTHSTEQVASKQFLYRSLELTTSLDALEKAHIEGLARCGVTGNLMRRKPRSNRAVITMRLEGNFWVPSGMTLAVVELEDSQGKTYIDAYTPHEGWHDFIDVLIAQMQGENRCFKEGLVQGQ